MRHSNLWELPFRTDQCTKFVFAFYVSVGFLFFILIRTQASSVFSEVSAAPPTNSGGFKVFVPAVVPSRLIADIQPENLELTRSPPSSRSPQFFWSSLIFLFPLLVSPLTEFSEPPLLGLSIKSLNV